MNGDKRDSGADFLLVAASLVVVIAGLRAAASLITPFLLAVFIALVSLPLLNWLQGLRLPRPLAVVTTLAVALAVLGGLVWVVGGSIREFTGQVPKYKARLYEMRDAILTWVEARGLEIPPDADLELLNPARVLDLMTGTLGTLTSVLSNAVLVFLIITFILVEAAGFSDKLLAAFGARPGTQRLDRIRRDVQRYLGIKSIVSLTTGSLVYLALSIIGVDFALLWSTLAFLLNYIPNLGSIIAAVPPVLLSMVQLGPGQALAVAVVFVAINVGMGNFIEPYLMGRQLGLSTLVVFLSLVFWGWVFGPIGMLLSVPLTVIVKIMLENTEDLRWLAVVLGSGPPSSGGSSAPAD